MKEHLHVAVDVFDSVRTELQLVEEKLFEQCSSQLIPVPDIVRNLIVGSNRRFRAGLHLLAAKLCGCGGTDIVQLGAAVELMHAAMIFHEEIGHVVNIREAFVRRKLVSRKGWLGESCAQSEGRTGRSAKREVSVRVLGGDWFIARALQGAIRERNFRVLEVLTIALRSMVEGQFMQLRQSLPELNEEAALETYRRRTACLFSACTQLGALLGRRTHMEEARLASYGMHVGLAFQVIDDLLELTSDEWLIKCANSGLPKGRHALLLAYAFEAVGESQRKRLLTLMRGDKSGSSVGGEYVGLLRRSGALERARKKAIEFATTATNFLRTFSDSVYKRALLEVPSFILGGDYLRWEKPELNKL